jgi:nucleotide-binding universal stress UspA family protein
MTIYSDVSDFMSSSRAATDRLKLLLPLDGSEEAERALVMVRALCFLGDVEAYLLSVVDDRDLEFQPDVVADQERLRRVYLEQRVRPMLENVATCDAAVVRGNPIACISDEADRIKADLVLVTSKRGDGHWLRGSLSDKIVRDCSCNTLVLGTRSAPEKITSVLLPLDGSALAETAVPVAENLAKLLRADLHVVRVVPPPPLPLDADRHSHGVPFDNARLTAALTEMAQRYVERIGTQAEARYVEVRHGLPAEMLLDYLEEKAIDLVVMTPHGRTGPVRNALGSVTDRMLEGSASVLITRAPAMLS